MADIKLIKKTIPFADGFEMHQDSNHIKTPDGSFWESLASNTFVKTYYPLFLQKVVDGMNYEFMVNDFFDFNLSQDCIGICVFKITNKLITFEGITDESKEKAIKYVLNNMDNSKVYIHANKEASGKFVSERIDPKIKDITIGGKKIDVKPVSFNEVKGSSNICQ